LSSYKLLDGRKIRVIFVLVAVVTAFAKQFANVFLLRRLWDISNEAGGHLKNSELLVFDTCCMALWAGRPSYKLQFPAMSFSTAAMSAENMPCLVQISTVAMSAKMPYLKYALSHPGSLYATKRGHASTATQHESFPKPVNSTRSTDHSAKVSISADAKAGFGRELGYRQQAERQQSARMTSDANPSVSLWFEQFP
jgi:hypothetical protein